MQEQPRPRRARLTLPRHAHPGDDAVHRPLLVGIGEHNRGTLAPKFQRDRNNAIGGRMHDQLADFGRSGERQLADERMARERRACLLAVPGNEVQDAGRQMVVADLRDAAADRAAHPPPPSAPACCLRRSPSQSSACPATTGAFHGTMPPTTPIGSRRV